MECHSFIWRNRVPIVGKHERTLIRKVYGIGRAPWHCRVIILKACGGERHRHFWGEVRLTCVRQEPMEKEG